MKVMLLAKASPETETMQPPSAEAMLAMHQFNEELEQAGVLVTLGGLTPSSRGARLRFNGTTCTVIDGPFAESKELIAGYSILEVKTFAEAIAWAKRAPFGLCVPAGQEAEVELRPLFDPSDFDVPGEAEEREKKLGKQPGKS